MRLEEVAEAVRTITCAISDRRPMLLPRVVLMAERLRGASAGGQPPAGFAPARPGAGQHEQGLGVEIREPDCGQVGAAARHRCSGGRHSGKNFRLNE